MSYYVNQVTNYGYTAAGVATGLIASITLGAISNNILTGTVLVLAKKYPEFDHNANGPITWTGRITAVSIVMGAVLLGFGSMYILSLLPITLTQAEQDIALSIYAASQTSALYAAGLVVTSNEEAWVASWFTDWI